MINLVVDINSCEAAWHGINKQFKLNVHRNWKTWKAKKKVGIANGNTILALWTSIVTDKKYNGIKVDACNHLKSTEFWILWMVWKIIHFGKRR